MTTARKKACAPKRNRNGRKHGVYSPFIPAADEVEMANMESESMADELAMARVHMKNALEQEAAAEDPDLKLAWHREARADLHVIVNIKSRSVERCETELTYWIAIKVATRKANDRQKVRK